MVAPDERDNTPEYVYEVKDDGTGVEREYVNGLEIMARQPATMESPRTGWQVPATGATQVLLADESVVYECAHCRENGVAHVRGRVMQIVPHLRVHVNRPTRSVPVEATPIEATSVKSLRHIRRGEIMEVLRGMETELLRLLRSVRSLEEAMPRIIESAKIGPSRERLQELLKKEKDLDALRALLNAAKSS